jgi:hypothetical protein
MIYGQNTKAEIFTQSGTANTDSDSNIVIAPIGTTTGRNSNGYPISASDKNSGSFQKQQNSKNIDRA